MSFSVEPIFWRLVGGQLDAYTKIAETWEIPRNTMKLFNTKGHEILVINVEGCFHACDNKCPHMGLPLYLGSLDGKVLTCGFHYAKFDVTTGESLGPATKEPLNTYEVRIKNSLVLIKLPERSNEMG
jgi:nitrite reductase/ring-hydroxylating ferredoxin subunit